MTSLKLSRGRLQIYFPSFYFLISCAKLTLRWKCYRLNAHSNLLMTGDTELVKESGKWMCKQNLAEESFKQRDLTNQSRFCTIAGSLSG